MRTNWMVHLITNWMGDGAWLWKLSAAVMKFNYLGDAHVVHGTVAAVRAADGRHEVDVAVEGRNQRDVVTRAGRPRPVLLPSGSSPARAVSIPEADLTDVPPASAPDHAVTARPAASWPVCASSRSGDGVAGSSATAILAFARRRT